MLRSECCFPVISPALSGERTFHRLTVLINVSISCLYFFCLRVHIKGSRSARRILPHVTLEAEVTLFTNECWPISQNAQINHTDSEESVCVCVFVFVFAAGFVQGLQVLNYQHVY